MVKYHISPKTGRANACKARVKPCPLGSENDHYPTKEAAQTAYETKMKSETLRKTSTTAAAKETLNKETEKDWARLRDVNLRVDAVNKLAQQELRKRDFYDKAKKALSKAKEAEDRPVEDYAYGEANKRGTVHGHASEALRELQKAEPYSPNRGEPLYPSKNYPDLESVAFRAEVEKIDTEMRLQEYSDELDALEAEKSELTSKVVAKTGFAENPRYGIPTGETTLEKYAGTPARSYSSNPTKDVEVLKDAKRFCTKCGEEVVYDKAAYRTLHSNGDGSCSNESVKAYTGSEPPYTQYVSANAVCSYCGTGDPAHHTFKQQAYSDESSCSRCGGTSGYGIGD